MFWRAYDVATTALLAIAGVVMFALAIGNALLRYFFASPLVWGEEISRYAMVWGTMIGVALAYRAGSHVAIALFGGVLSRRGVLGLRILSHLLALATAYMLARSGWPLIAMLGRIEAPSSTIAMAWVYAAVPAGAALLAVEALRLLVRDGLALVRPAASRQGGTA
jgi:TRAP-type C4-dicarboxylate transport system permease small subunit